MYIIVECPEHIIRGEQVGVRVTIFNYWFGDEFIEASILFYLGFSEWIFFLVSRC